MALSRVRPDTGVIPFDQQDPFGRTTLPGVREILTDTRLRRWQRARTTFFHRVKNGFNDPLTFFQLVEELANLKPNQSFTAAELATHLNARRPMFTWDPMCVGRILGDLIENWNEANPGEQHQPLVTFRRWSGREYLTTSYPAARAVLANLIDDLAVLGETVQGMAARGQRWPRLSSPLSGCPSVVLPLVEAV